MSAQRVCFASLLAFSLAACQPAPVDSPASSQPAVDARADSAHGEPIAGSSVAPAGVALTAKGEHAATPRYKIDIDYPSLSAEEAPLAATLHKVAALAKQEFLQALPDPHRFPEFADRQMRLLIDFRIAARTPDLVSVRETGMQDTGGAHPIPIDSTIVYDVRAHRTVPLDDLFIDADAARKALADYARTELTRKIMSQAPRPGEGSPGAIAEWKTNARKMIDDGTQPTTQNFANFIVRAGADSNAPSPGLILIFPPYQVAAYVYGTQTVDVPDPVFMHYLKPQYHAAFGRTAVE
ncbi:MAG TPA: RsiV family protein [Rhodanobacteraceae bacterium]